MRFIFVVVLCLVGLMIGCDSQDQQRDFERDSARPPAGFTETNAQGEVLSEDKDDWRTAPAYIGVVQVRPAHPNPPGDQFVNIPVSVYQFDRVQGGLRLRAWDHTDSYIILDRLNEASEPGSYLFTFSPGILGRRGLVRVFVTDGLGYLVSYGDIMVE